MLVADEMQARCGRGAHQLVGLAYSLNPEVRGPRLDGLSTKMRLVLSAETWWLLVAPQPQGAAI